MRLGREIELQVGLSGCGRRFKRRPQVSRTNIDHDEQFTRSILERMIRAAIFALTRGFSGFEPMTISNALPPHDDFRAINRFSEDACNNTVNRSEEHTSELQSRQH